MGVGSLASKRHFLTRRLPRPAVQPFSAAGAPRRSAAAASLVAGAAASGVHRRRQPPRTVQRRRDPFAEPSNLRVRPVAYNGPRRRRESRRTLVQCVARPSAMSSFGPGGANFLGAETHHKPRFTCPPFYVSRKGLGSVDSMTATATAAAGAGRDDRRSTLAAAESVTTQAYTSARTVCAAHRRLSM